jgi:hypothetical protein
LSLLFAEHCDGQFDPLAALANPGPQEKGAKMLFHRPWTDIQLTRDFFIAAALHEQMEYLLIAGGDFDLVQIDHLVPPTVCQSHFSVVASLSPFLRGKKKEEGKYLRYLLLRSSDLGFHVAFRMRVLGSPSSKSVCERVREEGKEFDSTHAPACTEAAEGSCGTIESASLPWQLHLNSDTFDVARFSVPVRGDQ